MALNAPALLFSVRVRPQQRLLLFVLFVCLSLLRLVLRLRMAFPRLTSLACGVPGMRLPQNLHSSCEPTFRCPSAPTHCKLLMTCRRISHPKMHRPPIALGPRLSTCGDSVDDVLPLGLLYCSPTPRTWTRSLLSLKKAGKSATALIITALGPGSTACLCAGYTAPTCYSQHVRYGFAVCGAGALRLVVSCLFVVILDKRH